MANEYTIYTNNELHEGPFELTFTAQEEVQPSTIKAGTGYQGTIT
ncbi:hypothetical protein [Enterococcus olivae]